MTTPFQRLRELAASGQLARAHPQVAPLLAEITDAGDREPAAVLAELARCGHLLRGLAAPDVLAHHPDTPSSPSPSPGTPPSPSSPTPSPPNSPGTDSSPASSSAHTAPTCATSPTPTANCAPHNRT
ncbi:hypothetical protein QA942_27530 [Streptomyces sp. B21-106]|uniref:hypothetical protein n=1 Tax=Streptomyces sp. B21-106 TaxID=3039418 RepID=UPI002FF2829B